MGTSTQWAGATQQTRWSAGDRKLAELGAALSEWTELGDDDRARAHFELAVMECGNAYLTDLGRNIHRDGLSSPVRQTLLAAGERIADAVTATSTELLDLAKAPASPENGETLTDVVEVFLGVLGMGSGAVLDAAVRRAVAPAILATLSDLRQGRQPADGGGLNGSASSESLFCLLYRHFFAHAVAQTVTTVITAKIRLAAPVLHLFDPAGLIAAWIAKRVFSLLPNPCDHPVDDDGGNLASLGRAVLRETVDRALGVWSHEPEMGVAA